MEERRDARRPALWGPESHLLIYLILSGAEFAGGRKGENYLRLRPCMTASGPEDVGASWVGRQFLKSAHWTRESPLSAIRVLRDTEHNSQHVYWK